MESESIKSNVPISTIQKLYPETLLNLSIDKKLAMRIIAV